MADAQDETQDQILGNINMPELELGPTEFDWQVKPPNYTLLESKFNLLDTSAFVIKLSFKAQEFLRLSYLVVHSFKDEKIQEDLPEDFELDQLVRKILISKPILKHTDINWSENNN